MQTVTVNASTRYEVLIEKGLLSRTGEAQPAAMETLASIAASPEGPHLLSVAHDLLAAHVRHQTESACKAFVAL